jgi:RNA polymerase sigma-70 factor, ECF subfamily
VEDILRLSDSLARNTDEDADRAGRADRIGALFDRHQVRLFALARRLSQDREAARDLVQDAFVRALGHRLPADDAGAEAWLVRTLVNLCRDRHRRQRVRTRDLRHELGGATPSDPESRAVARSTVATALAALPPRQRAVVVLAELEDRGVPEIAALLGIAQVTVRWHLAAGRRRLARYFGKVSS